MEGVTGHDWSSFFIVNECFEFIKLIMVISLEISIVLGSIPSTPTLQLRVKISFIRWKCITCEGDDSIRDSF